jgi:hypothetical protein
MEVAVTWDMKRGWAMGMGVHHILGEIEMSVSIRQWA